MTGTPVANRPYDMWAQIFFLDHGKSLGCDFEEFKKATDLSNKLADDTMLQHEFEKSISQIHDKIKDFTVRETKASGIISLPAKVYIHEDAQLNAEQAALYERISTEMKLEVLKDGLLIEDDSTAIVKRLLRLVQVISNPRLVDESFLGESSKEVVLDKLIRMITDNGEKCIIWTSFIENVNYFNQKYHDYGCVKIHGGMSMFDRNRSVERFRTDEYKLLFATPASAKEGLTLTMANHVVFYDRSFSLDDYLQAQDRIHRISQTRTCYIHNIIANDTIDEWIDLLLEAKQNAARLSQGDITLQEYRKTSDYSFGEVVRSILQINPLEDEENG
jgi:SNF2 family DNA or RNA helicase